MYAISRRKITDIPRHNLIYRGKIYFFNHKRDCKRRCPPKVVERFEERDDRYV